MRREITGVLVGIAVAFIVVAALRQFVIHEIEPDISYRFDHYVFTGTAFPAGDFIPGRIVHRFLFPSRATVRFYDAGYHEVKQAEKPGRYGAVVRLNLAGDVAWRFITLYRLASAPGWWSAPWSMSLQFAPTLGIDRAAGQAQQAEINEMLRRDFVGRGDASPGLAVLLAGLAETPPDAVAAGARDDVAARDDAWWYGLREKLGLAPRYRYLARLPRDYDADASKHWPLIVYLHSGAEHGADLRQVRRTGLALELERGRQLPAIVISPQSPESRWNLAALDHFFDDIARKYRVDADRIYLTGGTAAWQLAAAFPHRFAAILPIGGKCAPGDAAGLKDTPVWAFISDQDEMTPASETRASLDAVRRAGGHPHATTLNSGADIWSPTYAMEAIYPWLLAQKRGQAEVTTPGVPPS